jgi:hypothetical protein
MSRERGLAFAAGLLAACALAGAPASGAGRPAPPAWTLHGSYSPVIKPANFVASVNNRYFPLRPGTAFHYRGVRDQAAQTDDMIVTGKVKYVVGVKCTVVEDTVSENGKPVERTYDWYAQDKQGNVWYMGEDSFELQHGHFVKASDSWQAGVNGGKPGIIMPAHPRPGDAYRQEFYPPGKALDQARVLRLTGTLTVPDGSFRHVLVTSEKSPAEPQTEQKYYAPGVGEIAERVVKGHHEAFQLVRVTH